MKRETALSVRYLPYQENQAGERRRRRLVEDLGLEGEAVEVIMRLCDQVSALQARLREVESRLEIYQAGHGARLARYRESYSEAAWEDIFSE